MKEKEDSKVVVTLNGVEYVMSASKVTALLDVASTLERYEHYTDWRAEGRPESHHVWEEPCLVRISTLPSGMYQMAKLAGKRTTT